MLAVARRRTMLLTEMRSPPHVAFLHLRYVQADSSRRGEICGSERVGIVAQLGGLERFGTTRWELCMSKEPH